MRAFAVAGGQVTASMKIRRRVMEECYPAQIEALFAAHKKMGTLGYRVTRRRRVQVILLQFGAV
jgi:hypothetical protein